MLPKSSLGRIGLALAGLAIVAVALYGSYWRWTAEKIEAGLPHWAEARRAEGYRVAWKSVELGGFPGEFRLAFDSPSFAADRPLPVRFEAPRLVVWAAPWDLRHWQFTAPESAKLAAAQDFAGFDLAELEGSVGVAAGDIVIIDAKASTLGGAGLLAGTQIAVASTHLEIPSAPPASHREIALEAALRLADLKTEARLPGFGDTLSELSFTTQLKGSLPPGSLAHALAQWRDEGGTVELKDFHLRWGGLLIDANGTLALDAALQPEAACTAVITGQDAAVDLAVTAGALQSQDATIVKAVLGLLAKPGPSGEKAITVPLSLQQSRLYLGPAAIGTVPPIHWE